MHGTPQVEVDASCPRGNSAIQVLVPFGCTKPAGAPVRFFRRGC